jgi:hypothetical protein
MVEHARELPISSPVRAPNSHVMQALSSSVATLEAIDRGPGPAKA